MSYTELFSEVHKLLSINHYSGVTTEQNTTWVSLQNYHRAVVMVLATAVGTTLDVDIEVSNTGTGNGTNVATLKSATQLGGSDDSDRLIFEIQSEELSKPTGASGKEYEYLRVESTPSGSGSYVVLVFGLEPRFSPVSSGDWDQVIT